MARHGYYQTDPNKEYTSEVNRYWTLKGALDYAERQNEFDKEARYFVEKINLHTYAKVATYM
jgi:hypothetical protein